MLYNGCKPGQQIKSDLKAGISKPEVKEPSEISVLSLHADQGITSKDHTLLGFFMCKGRACCPLKGLVYVCERMSSCFLPCFSNTR